MCISKNRCAAITAGLIGLIGALSWPAMGANGIGHSSSVSASINGGELLTYGFTANKDEAVHISVVNLETKSGFEPRAWLYGPDGRVIAKGSHKRVVAFDCHSKSYPCRLQLTGPYRLVVTDKRRVNPGQVRIEFLNVTKPGAALTGGAGNASEAGVVGEQAESGKDASELDNTTNDSTDVQRQTVLQQYQAQYPSGVFFTPQDEANDGLPYLGGQCIAWAERLYDAAATMPVSDYSYGVAANIPDVLQAEGYTVVTNPEAPKVGALIVWEEPDKYGSGKDGAGHVGVVTAIKQGPLQKGGSYEIVVSEANFPDSGSSITEELAAKWGLSVEEARKEIVTTSYGIFQERVFDTGALGRGIYQFKAYVYP